jgi:tetratricopeptide (TPR) repeat protein
MTWFVFFCVILISYLVGNLLISLIENIDLIENREERSTLVKEVVEKLEEEKKLVQNTKEKKGHHSFVEKAEKLQIIGLYQEAEIAYRKAVDLYQGKNSTFLRNDFALLLVKNGKYQEAIDIYQSILQEEIQEERSENVIKATKSNLAWALLMHADHQEARKYAKQAAFSDPSDVDEKWKYHWRKLVLSLCDMLEKQDPNYPCPEIQTLEKLLGKDHDRVKLAQLRHQIIINYVIKLSTQSN